MRRKKTLSMLGLIDPSLERGQKMTNIGTAAWVIVVFTLCVIYFTMMSDDDDRR